MLFGAQFLSMEVWSYQRTRMPRKCFLSHSQLGGQISNSQPEWPQTGIARVHDAHGISGKDQLNFQNSGTSVDWFNFLDGKVIYHFRFLFVFGVRKHCL